MSQSPSPTGFNGRNAHGRFASGNQFGRGNPHHEQVGKLRSTLLKAITNKDLRAIVKALIEKAKTGDVLAAREVLDRCLGKPKQTVDMDVEVAPETWEQRMQRMSDIEIVEAIEAAGLKPPPYLVRKIQLVKERHERAKSEPSKDPERARPKKLVRAKGSKKARPRPP